MSQTQRLFNKFKKKMGWGAQPYFILATDGDTEDKEGYMKIVADYNPAFIEQMKKLGVPYHNEQDFVQHVTFMLMATMSGFDFDAFEKQAGGFRGDTIQTLENGNTLRK